MDRIVVGDPAASSLSSCLRVFPGGVSLLTETGLLRPFLVSETSKDDGFAGVVAASPVPLSESPSEGTFPVEAESPIDHAWSQDGNILVVLRRFSYTAYLRHSTTAAEAPEVLNRSDPVAHQCCPPGDRKGLEGGTGPCTAEAVGSPPNSSYVRSLGLTKVYSGNNGFGGKVVACCSLSSLPEDKAATSTPAGSISSTAQQRSRGVSSQRWTCFIAVGGSSGVECHALECDQRVDIGADSDKPRHKSRELRQASSKDGGGPTASNGIGQLLTRIFRGYPVVAVAISHDSVFLAAASMTGHVKVWHIAALVATPSHRQSDGVEARKESTASGRVESKNDSLGTRRSKLLHGAPPDVAALWEVALPMARVTSLSFSPDDSAVFALACWDGKVALFLPAAGVQVPAAPADTTLRDASKRRAQKVVDGGDNDIKSKRSWKHVWREATAATTSSTRGGREVENLEDQDGAFLCWCLGIPNSEVLVADLAVSTYHMKTGDCLRRRRCVGNDPDDSIVSSGGEREIAATNGMGLLRRKPSQEAFPPAMATGPGFELFAERGLGERVGGAMLGSRPTSLPMEATAERYLVHGLAAGPSFVALYDSDRCLHVVSLAAILSAGHVMALLPPPPTKLFPMPSAELVSSQGKSMEASCEAEDEETPTSMMTKVTLVNNDHGFVAACVRQHRGIVGEEVSDSLPTEEGLELSITWRNAVSKVETPDGGNCVGRDEDEGNRRLPFLPGKLEMSDEGVEGYCGNGGVFCADIRWGQLALFTRYTVLVYTHTDKREAARKTHREKGGNPPAVTPFGSWRAYAEYPVVHGVLLGGPSTATPFSQHLPKPPVDLENIYLLTVLGVGGAADDCGCPLLCIRSLGDRAVVSRYPQSPDTAEDNAERVFASNDQGARVYVSPGYGVGVFAVAVDGKDGECAKVWRGTFDEGSNRLELEPSRVITSHPWPEPETLRLQGVVGPNCEVFLFKEAEVGGPCPEGGASSSGGGSVRESVRWWMTWPEAELWRWVDAPAMLGDEDFGVSDLANIFQLEIEEVLSSHSHSTRAGSERGRSASPDRDKTRTGCAFRGGV